MRKLVVSYAVKCPMRKILVLIGECEKCRFFEGYVLKDYVNDAPDYVLCSYREG